MSLIIDIWYFLATIIPSGCTHSTQTTQGPLICNNSQEPDRVMICNFPKKQ